MSGLPSTRLLHQVLHFASPRPSWPKESQECVVSICLFLALFYGKVRRDTVRPAGKQRPVLTLRHRPSQRRNRQETTSPGRRDSVAIHASPPIFFSKADSHSRVRLSSTYSSLRREETEKEMTMAPRIFSRCRGAQSSLFFS